MGFNLMSTFLFWYFRSVWPKNWLSKITWNIYRLWMFWGVPTGNRLLLPCPPTAGVAHWSCVMSTWTPGYTGVWTAPIWSQSNSWIIHTSLSAVAATLLWGGWLYFSGKPLRSHLIAHWMRLQKAKSDGVAGGNPPDTFSILSLVPREDTSLVSSLHNTWHQCSQHACREHCPSHSTRSHGSVGCPSGTWPPAATPWSGLLCH